MSRIHDALKKAEQERTRRSYTSLEAESAELSDIGASGREAVFPPPPDEPEVSFRAEIDQSLEPLTIEILNSKVRRNKWNPDPKTMLFFGDESYAPGTEEFRTLRTRLYGMRDLQPLRTVLITSASPREGKSFISANLAQILVQQPNRRVLLIDADLRWSRLHMSLGTSSAPGLSDYLMGEAGELAILQRGLMDNLYFIPGGKHAANPAELLANGRLGQLLQRLGPLFDWVIVDSPPAMAVSDPRLMAGVCDGVLVVVAAGLEPFDVVQKTTRQFKDRRLLGVVLNRSAARNTYSYKYYGYYHGPEKDRKKSRKEK
jgi:capsular exopolysaccharide synthesis family protein